MPIISSTQSIDSTMDSPKMLEASELHINESLILHKRCMSMVGFSDDETQECGELFTFFFGKALEYEIDRLEHIRHCIPKDFLAEEPCSILFMSDMNSVKKSKLEMMRKALMRYRYESYYTMVKCMIKAGFTSSDTEVFDPRYQDLLESVLKIELTLWKSLRSTFRREHIIKYVTIQSKKPCDIC